MKREVNTPRQSRELRYSWQQTDFEQTIGAPAPVSADQRREARDAGLAALQELRELDQLAETTERPKRRLLQTVKRLGASAVDAVKSATEALRPYVTRRQLAGVALGGLVVAGMAAVQAQHEVLQVNPDADSQSVLSMDSGANETTLPFSSHYTGQFPEAQVPDIATTVDAQADINFYRYFVSTEALKARYGQEEGEQRSMNNVRCAEDLGACAAYAAMVSGDNQQVQ